MPNRCRRFGAAAVDGGGGRSGAGRRLVTIGHGDGRRWMAELIALVVRWPGEKGVIRIWSSITLHGTGWGWERDCWLGGGALGKHYHTLVRTFEHITLRSAAATTYWSALGRDSKGIQNTHAHTCNTSQGRHGGGRAGGGCVCVDETI